MLPFQVLLIEILRRKFAEFLKENSAIAFVFSTYSLVSVQYSFISLFFLERKSFRCPIRQTSSTYLVRIILETVSPNNIFHCVGTLELFGGQDLWLLVTHICIVTLFWFPPLILLKKTISYLLKISFGVLLSQLNFRCLFTNILMNYYVFILRWLFPSLLFQLLQWKDGPFTLSKNYRP